MEHSSLQHKFYFGPDAIHVNARAKYNSSASQESAAQGKYAMANWLDDYNSLTKSDSQACSKIHAAHEKIDTNPKDYIGLPCAIAGRNQTYRNEDREFISGKEYCLLHGYTQTERGKKRNK